MKNFVRFLAATTLGLAIVISSVTCGSEKTSKIEKECDHEWEEATCKEPKTCSECGKTKGEKLEHEWVDATYESPKTCLMCKLTEGEAIDPIKEAKDKLEKAYNKCCSYTIKDKNASLGYDGMSLIIDTDYYDDGWDKNEKDALAAIVSVNSYLEIPSSVLEKMTSTRAIDGLQSQNCGIYTLTWNYHPDNGLRVIYEVTL